jgi:hypothetical protein
MNVRPKSPTFAIGGPVLRTYHPYSDKELERRIAKSDRDFNLRRELARNDRTIAKLRDYRRKGKVLYA